MKTLKPLLFALFIFITIKATCLDYNTKDTYYNHLKEVNKEWVYHKNACPKGLISFNSDKERISLHLKLVCNELAKTKPLNFDNNQLQERKKLILELLKYADNKVFPINLIYKNRQPCFIDHRGVHCAVGYLMQQSGHDELAIKISKDYNYAYVKDIKTKGVVEWSKKYGFTIEELKWIQPIYPPDYFSSCGNGTNNSVNGLCYDPVNDQIILTGIFDSINGFPCSLIGSFKNEQYTCLNNGFSGQINDLFIDTNIFICGNLINGTDTFSYAVLQNNVWNFYNIPNRTGAMATAFNKPLNAKLEIAVNHPTNPINQEIWQLDNSNNWIKIAEVDGQINDIINSSYGSVYAGKFNHLYEVNNIVIINTINTNNFCIKDNQQNWLGYINTDIPTEINSLEIIADTLFMAGKCNNANDVCLINFIHDSIRPLIINDIDIFSSNNSTEIKTIKYAQHNHTLKVGGNFYLAYYNDWGVNLIGYFINDESVYDLGKTNQTVNCLAYYGDTLFAGGDFTKNVSNNYNYIMRLVPYLDYANIKEKNYDEFIKIYPNPTTDKLNIQTNNFNSDYFEIFNMLGQSIKKQKMLNTQTSIDVSTLENGCYLIVFTNKNGQKIKKHFIKE